MTELSAAVPGTPGSEPSATRSKRPKSSAMDRAGLPVLGKRAARRLESDRFLLDMLDNVQLVAMTLDERAHVTFCNDYLLRLTGWRREEVLGEDWATKFLAPGQRMQPVFEALLTGRPDAWHHENEIVTRTGE